MSKSEFEHYRTAGELFGRLRAHLGFGHLSMHLNECSVKFSWRFNAKEKRYAFDVSFTFEELATQTEGYFAKLAEDIADRWKSESRAASGNKSRLCQCGGVMVHNSSNFVMECVRCGDVLAIG